ncbi:EI24 domain-containing protein [Acidisphaera sp. L21]|uniref:EI24 domain-containing protein n=1 Tax=Acidisphaera sp. L21 TaxID=1641851 RepID=UPI00131E5B7C|nr:EI24 domain-containing protein [Acidisphaera sp. L21]
MKALWLAVAQLDDPACLSVLIHSVLLSLVAYAILLGGSIWGVHEMLAAVHWPGWLAAIIGTLGVVLLAFWLFLPTVILIATLYMERIARAVDARHYPYFPSPEPAPLSVQLWDGLTLAVRVLLLNLVALALAFLPIPGIGLALAILVSGWAIGRGLFVAVAMRRMDRGPAQALYRSRRMAVLLPGMALAVAAMVPGLNLLVPIVGTAAMVHVLNRSPR